MATQAFVRRIALALPEVHNGEARFGIVATNKGKERAAVRELQARRARSTVTWWVLLLALSVAACDRGRPAPARSAPPAPPEAPSPDFRNVSAAATGAHYVGDSSCVRCHARESTVYASNSMAQSFHRWTAATRVESTLVAPLVNRPTGLSYSVIDEGGRLFQVEFLDTPDGRRLHELRRRIDYVMGSGHVARSYFTEENGRLFQLPLTWYDSHGWDFSPGYEVNNARFDRMLPDRCIACHSSYPTTLPALEGKYAALPPGIGCERCHGPGSLHLQQHVAPSRGDTLFDASIVNPRRMSLERRLDLCDQCHVHTPVAVLREGKDAFSYMPSQPLRDQWAFFKVAGSIDVVSHADRLRQSACFLASRNAASPLECATCHDPHRPTPDSSARNQPCRSCHAAGSLSAKLAQSPALAAHTPTADCVSCHMPRIKERTVPHGTFTEHWIRKVPKAPVATIRRDTDASPIEPYFARDSSGVEAALYTGLGEMVYASLAGDGQVLDHAASTLERELARDSTHAQALFLLGVAYEQRGKTDRSIATLERAVHIDSTRPEALRALAEAYRRAGRPPAGIEALYRRALAVQPALAWIRAEYADLLAADGRVQEAEREYRAALLEQPSLAATWFNLGTLLSEPARATEAADAFHRAVELDPTMAQALGSLIELKTDGPKVSRIRALAPPLASLLMRERRADAFAITVASDNRVAFLNVSRGFVLVTRPDGTLVRAIPTDDGGVVRWDLLDDAGRPIGAGLYRARLQGRDAGGKPVPPQAISFGVVRPREM